MMKRRSRKVLSMLGLVGATLTLTKTQKVEASPEVTPASLEEYWSQHTEGEVGNVSREMMEQQERDIIKLADEISNNKVKRTTLEKEVEEKIEEIAETEKEIQEKTLLHEKRYESAKERAVSLQQKGESSAIEMLNAVLNSDSLADAFGRIQAVKTLTEANSQIMEDLETERIKLEEMNEKLAKDKEQLDSKKEKLEVLIEELRVQKEVAEKVQAEMQEKWDSQEAEKEEILAEQRRVMEEVQKELEEQRQLFENSGSGMDTSMQVSYSDLVGRKTNPQTSNHVLSNALSYIGTPYVWGGTTPSGFDCSGLTQYVYRDAGVSLPRTAAQQSNKGERVSMNELEPGDLLFWGAQGSSYHVGIYIGNGSFVHAPKPGDSVKITKMKHFRPDFAKRVLPENTLKVVEETTFNSVIGTAKAPSIEGKNVTLKEGLFSVTYYSAYDGTQIGITAGGTSMANGNIQTEDGYRIVAVDPNVIPMGTILRVTTGKGETFLAKADDTGGVIKGNRIDIAVSSKAEALRLGRTDAVIEIVH